MRSKILFAQKIFLNSLCAESYANLIFKKFWKMRSQTLFAQESFLNILCTEFYTNLILKRIWKIRGKILFAQKNFLNIFLYRVLYKSGFKKIFEKCVAKFYLLRYVKCGCYSTISHKTKKYSSALSVYLYQIS